MKYKKILQRNLEGVSKSVHQIKIMMETGLNKYSQADVQRAFDNAEEYISQSLHFLDLESDQFGE